MEPLDAAIRLFVYESAVGGSIPSPVDVARRFDISPVAAGSAFRRLEIDHDAVVLFPGSRYIWMAEPFAAAPTDYVVRGETGSWFGNCIWDALGIASLVGKRCQVETACPSSGTELRLGVENGHLVRSAGVVHFAVPASKWWESIGFT